MPSYSRKLKIPGKTSHDLYQKIDSDIDRFLEKSAEKIPFKFEIERLPSQKQLKMKSSMITATLICMDEIIEVDASLSLLATPFKSKIDEGIDRWLAKAFGIG